MTLHKEIAFEDEICGHLAGQGWLHADRDAALYDRARAIFPPDLIAWIQASQPDAWAALVKSHGPAAETMLLDRVRKQMDDRRTLEVMRHGVEMIGLRRPLALAQFRPAMGMNADIVVRYQANRLRVVRQVRYSRHNENSLDLVQRLRGFDGLRRA
jgi:type I restriction enzyme R subunit